MTQSTSPAPQKWWQTFLGSSWIIGVTGVAALALSLWQILWPIYLNKTSSYSVDIDSPDLVNLFCSGSEGIDQSSDKRPLCDGNNSLVLLATPLFYINTGGPNKIVWLRREIVDLDFLNQAERTVKKLTLAWERVSSTEAWHAPGVDQIEPEKAISHSTLFYPESFGCGKDVSSSDCQADNTYKWSDFADKVLNHEITHISFTFEPAIRGPSKQIAPVKCRWTFDAGVIIDLRKWREQLDTWNKTPPEKRGSVEIPYSNLAANCIAAKDG